MYTTALKRTQIYLEEDVLRDLREVADAEGRSVAAIIREAVRAHLATRDDEDWTKDDPFLRMAGAFTGGPADGAENHDRYLYGRGHEDVS